MNETITRRRCDVPEDVLIEILAWLPVISLVRFKAVCKSWFALVESPNLIAQHLQKGSKSSSSLIVKNKFIDIVKNTNDVESFHLFTGHNFDSCINLDFPQCIKQDNTTLFHMVSLVNGIVCIYDVKSWDVFLWNPATKQSTLLPDIVPHNETHFICVGFGYDDRTNAYKVVRLIFPFKILDDDGVVVDGRVDLYASTTNSWRILDTVLPVHRIIQCDGGNGAYQNGVYIWLGTTRIAAHTFLRSIVSFDFSDEVFQNMALPNDITYAAKLGFIGESIGFMNTWKYHRIEIWVLNEYGIKESWSKLHTIGSFESDENPTWFLKHGDLLLLITQGHDRVVSRLILCDPDTQEMKDLLPDQQCPEWMFIDAVPYKESLVSINAGANRADL